MGTVIETFNIIMIIDIAHRGNHGNCNRNIQYNNDHRHSSSW